VIEVDPHPAGFDALAAAGDLPLERVAALEVDAEQPVAVGARAGAATPRLDPEEVVQQRDDEVVVQVPRRPSGGARVADHEGDDRQALTARVAEDLEVRVGLPAADRPPDERVLAAADLLDADGGLELEDEPGADRLDDRGGAALLTVLGVGEVAVLGGVDVSDGPAARHARDRVGEQAAAGDEDP